MIALGVWPALLPDFVQELRGLPGKGKALAQTLQAFFELAAQERMVEDGLAKGDARLSKSERIGQRALRQGRAAQAVRHTGDIQHLQDQVNSLIGAAQQISLTLAQLNFAGRNRAGGNFVLEATNGVVQLSIFPEPREQEKRQT